MFPPAPGKKDSPRPASSQFPAGSGNCAPPISKLPDTFDPRGAVCKLWAQTGAAMSAHKTPSADFKMTFTTPSLETKRLHRLGEFFSELKLLHANRFDVNNLKLLIFCVALFLVCGLLERRRRVCWSSPKSGHYAHEAVESGYMVGNLFVPLG